MFEQRGSLPILPIVALQAIGESRHHGSVEEWVFAVHFFAAAPSRIARQVGLRSPEHENLTVVLLGLGDESSFIALHTARLANQVGIP